MEYVCSGATLKCTMGTSCPKLKATPKNVSLTGKDQANIADYVSMKNIPSFGRCRSLGYPPTASATAANHGKLTPMPCIPGTCPKWRAIDKDSLICGEPALLRAATLKCVYGGTISIINSGQTLEVKVRPVSLQSSKEQQGIPEELLQEFNDLDTEGLNKDSILDGIQFVLDAAGMVPVLGAIPDLLNASISALRGDWVGAGMSIVAAVPGVGDVVGGAKIAYKGAKIAGKVSAKSTKAGVAVAKSPSNVYKIGPAKSADKTLNSSDIKSGSVVRKNFDDLSKRRAKKALKAHQEEVKQVVNGNNSGYSYLNKNTITNSTEKIGSTSSCSTNTYRANPGEVVQEVTNAPRSGSATNKHSYSNNQKSGDNNPKTEETVNFEDFKKHKQETGKNPYDESPESFAKTLTDATKDEKQTKDARRNAENNVLSKNLNIKG